MCRVAPPPLPCVVSCHPFIMHCPLHDMSCRATPSATCHVMPPPMPCIVLRHPSATCHVTPASATCRIAPALCHKSCRATPLPRVMSHHPFIIYCPLRDTSCHAAPSAIGHFTSPLRHASCLISPFIICCVTPPTLAQIVSCCPFVMHRPFNNTLFCVVSCHPLCHVLCCTAPSAMHCVALPPPPCAVLCCPLRHTPCCATPTATSHHSMHHPISCAMLHCPTAHVDPHIASSICVHQTDQSEKQPAIAHATLWPLPAKPAPKCEAYWLTCPGKHKPEEAPMPITDSPVISHTKRVKTSDAAQGVPENNLKDKIIIVLD